MRVLTLTNGYPPHAYGGDELTCDDVMRRFCAARPHGTVVPGGERLPGVADAVEPHVHRRLRLYWDWEDNRPAIPRNPRARLRIEQHNLRELDAALHLSRPDIVSVWHMGALSLSLLAELEGRGIPM